MITRVSLMDDQMVDMAFITQLTGLTDKWFYKLIKDGDFPVPIKTGPQLPMAEKRSGSLAAGAYCTVPSVILNRWTADAVSGLPAAFCCLLSPARNMKMKPQYQTRYELLHESYQKWLTGFTRHAVSWGVSSEYLLLP